MTPPSFSPPFERWTPFFFKVRVFFKGGMQTNIYAEMRGWRAFSRGFIWMGELLEARKSRSAVFWRTLWCILLFCEFNC